MSPVDHCHLPPSAAPSTLPTLSAHGGGVRTSVTLACVPVSRQLKTKIEKEGSKRQLLGSQDCLSDSLCICCLQPFKFLVNSKRQCLDCRMFTCKACSRYNKKEHGWVCDNCRMTR